MLNNIKKISVICVMCLGVFLMTSNEIEASSKFKKSQNFNAEEINREDFNAVIYEKGEFDSTICHMGKTKGVNYMTKDGSCTFKLFFRYPLKKTSAAFGKTKTLLPSEAIEAAEIISLTGEGDLIDEFGTSNFYEFKNSRNYVLVSKDLRHRVDIWTDSEGIVNQLGIVTFESEQGIINYANAIKIITKKQNGLA